jgi:hypothetical protein
VVWIRVTKGTVQWHQYIGHGNECVGSIKGGGFMIRCDTGSF